MDPAGVLALESPGLCLFAPLMAGNPEELLLKSQQKIVGAPEALVSAETKRELLTILAGLSAKVIRDREFIAKLFSEIRLMEDNYFFELCRQEGHALGLIEGRREGRHIGLQEGREEGREAGREEGKRDEARQAIFCVLRRRFGEVAEGVRRRIETITAIEQLESLIAEAAVCSDAGTLLARFPDEP